MEKLTVAAVSTFNWIGQQERSLKNMEAWLERAREHHPDLVVFPELNISGYTHNRVAWKNAEPIPGPSTKKAIELAGKFQTTLCCGLLENSKDIVYNTQILVNGDGLIGKQRKIHIPADENPFWRQGSEIKTFDIGKARIGLAICFDSLFSELTRSLFFLGAEVLVMPFAYWSPVHRSRFPEEDITGINYRTTCYDNGFFGVLVNNAGERDPSDLEPNGFKFPGWAGVISPGGDVLDFTRGEGIGEAMSVVELDPELLADRRCNPWFQPRYLRPEVYIDIDGCLRDG
jgi:predicted amidohydrolase